MNPSNAKLSWKNIIPPVYEWLDQVIVDEASGLQNDALHVVGTDFVEDKKTVEFKSKTLDKQTQDQLRKDCEKSGWQGKGSLNVISGGKAFLLVPVCKIKTSLPQLGRQFGLDTARTVKELKVNQLIFSDVGDFDSADIFDGLANGFYAMGLFKNLKPKGPKQESEFPKKVSFVQRGIAAPRLKKLKAFLKASVLTRMLQDAPANWLTPVRFGDIAAEVAKEFKIKCHLHGRGELEEMGMGAFLSVAAGSPLEPRLICLEIDGEDNSRAIALVGKGLTFDTGGTSLKPAVGMGEMKYDMSGGAAVLGAAALLGQVKPPTKVVCIIGAVENMPGGTATRPGDIVIAMNGKSIDVLNTDAEGRLVLCDLLHYAVKEFKPEMIFDIATLTGAVLHALGGAGAAVMANDQKTADYVLKISKVVGEPFWQLPFWPELDKEVKSDVADLQNIAKPNVNAGTIIGGVFLKEFVGDTHWAHLDIAGTGWSCKATGFPASGGSAYGLRTLSELCYAAQG